MKQFVTTVPYGMTLDELENLEIPADATAQEEARKEARQRAIDRLAEEQYALLRKKPSRAKKTAEEGVQQMSLF